MGRPPPLISPFLLFLNCSSSQHPPRPRSPSTVEIRSDAEGWDDFGPGGAAWASRGVRIIDLDRSMDLAPLGFPLEASPPGTPAPMLLQGDSGEEGYRCPEMAAGLPWLWGADVFAAASTVHYLLTGGSPLGEDGAAAVDRMEG